MSKAIERKLDHAEDVITQAQAVVEAAVEKWPDDQVAADSLTRAARTVLLSYTGEDQ